MQCTSARVAAGLLGIAITILAGCSTAPAPKPLPPAAAPAPAPVVPSWRVTGVTLGRTVGADRSVAERVDAFAPTDTIYASVRTEGSATTATIKARWTYGAGQLVSEGTQTVAPAGGVNYTEFHIAKPDGWPAGAYDVEVFLNGASVQHAAFRVG